MRYLLILFLFLMPALSFAQESETIVVGYVRNAFDKSPIPAVNVYFEGTGYGTQTDEEGFYVLKHSGGERKVVFSSIGYKKHVATVRPGEPVSLNVQLREDILALQELIVFPGVNPATLLMKKVREAAGVNDVFNSQQAFRSNEEELVLMPVGSESVRSRFRKWTAGLVSHTDSTHFIPLFIAEEQLTRQGDAPHIIHERTSSASPENLQLIMEKLAGNLRSDFNFYHTSIQVFGKSVISPLASSGNAFYRYYLVDSVARPTGKQYYLRFWSKNPKNLAFNGEMYIDSATLALTDLTVELPRQANLNYVQALSVRQQFRFQGRRWIPHTTLVHTAIRYAVQVDSAQLIPEVYTYKRIHTLPDEMLLPANDGFAGTTFKKVEIESQIAELNEMPLMKTARWIADIIITGYAKFGKIDLGKVYQVARLTEEEGLRFTLPLRTNELLMPNVEVGGYWGYGLHSRRHYYSVNTGFKLPFERKTVVRASYTDDIRRTDYEYNDYMVKENPLLSGDIDIANSLVTFTTQRRLNARKEWQVSLSHDWNDDVESKLFFRSNRYFGNEYLPFSSDRGVDSDYLHQSLTLVTRFSSHERTYEDHLDRLYVPNERPVVYLIAEAGKTTPYATDLTYVKLLVKYKHKLLFPTGQWMYSVDAGWLFGDVPYNLFFNQGSGRALLHRKLHFNLMNYMEYSYDKYISTHQEVQFNGLLFNYLPLVKNWNLRELITLKAIYGGMDSDRSSSYDMPPGLSTSSKPYVEVGVGVTNIFKVASLQSVWRLTERSKPGVTPWGLVAGIRFNF